jgi:hypothetical protein
VPADPSPHTRLIHNFVVTASPFFNNVLSLLLGAFLFEMACSCNNDGGSGFLTSTVTFVLGQLVFDLPTISAAKPSMFYII